MIKVQIRAEKMQEGKMIDKVLSGEYAAVMCMCFKKDEDGELRLDGITAVDDMESRAIAETLARGFECLIAESFEDEPARVRHVGQLVGDNLKKVSRRMVIQKELRRHAEGKGD